MSTRIGKIVAISLSLSMMACSVDKTGNTSTSDSSQSAGSAALGSTWADAGKMPDLFTGTWWNFASFVEGDAKLNVPFTEKAQKYAESFKHKRDISYAEDGCKSPGLPIAMRLGGGIKFMYSPGLISIYMQSVSDTRFVRLNQEHGKTSPKFYGNSVGHWEGDTLVIETVDFLPGITFQYGVGKPLPPEDTRGTFNLGPLPSSAASAEPPREGAPLSLTSLSAAIWGPYGEGMRMVERMRLIDAETMEIQTTIYDDTVWTQPYVMAPRKYMRLQKGIREFGPFSGEPEEYVCTVSVTIFDPETNTYVDKDPEEMVKFLDKQSY